MDEEKEVFNKQPQLLLIIIKKIREETPQFFPRRFKTLSS